MYRLAVLHPESPDAFTTYYFYARSEDGDRLGAAERAWAQAEGYRVRRVRRAVLLFYVTAKDSIGAAVRTLEAFGGHEVWNEVVTELPPMVYRFVAVATALGPGADHHLHSHASGNGSPAHRED